MSTRPCTPGHPEGRSCIAIPLGVRNIAAQAERVAFLQVLRIAAHGQPHLAARDERLNSKGMHMRVEHRGGCPDALQYLIEALRARLGLELPEICSADGDLRKSDVCRN